MSNFRNKCDFFTRLLKYVPTFHIFQLTICRNNLLDLELVSSTDKKCIWKRYKEPVLGQFKAFPTETFCCMEPDRLPAFSPQRLAEIRKRLIECDDGSAISKHRFVY